MLRSNFATAITCMDGRIVAAVQGKIKEITGKKHVDHITNPGGDLPYTNERINSEHTKELDKYVRISVENHESRDIVVVSHEGCAGNPDSAQNHQQTLLESVTNLRARHGSHIKYYALYAHLNGDVRVIFSPKDSKEPNPPVFTKE